MAEYIKREDVEKMIEEQFDMDDNDFRYIKQMVLEKLPSVDIVHCQDCIYALGKVNKNNVICNKQDWATIWRENDFCSYGEREEQEE